MPLVCQAFCLSEIRRHLLNLILIPNYILVFKIILFRFGIFDMFNELLILVVEQVDDF